ncbi:MAG: S-methyl-5'-thioadenosine phosphorylase [Candidatus Aminicenantia bacterium]
MEKIEIGIIGGSGFYEIEGLKDLKEVKINTPFGEPSDSYFTGELEGRKVAFLSRHGRGHRFLPSEVNFRANIYGFKMLGAGRIISASAVGSMKENIRPMDVVIIDQFIDRTFRRINTFFGNGVAGHISFAHPICSEISSYLIKACKNLGISFHPKGTYICIEGPAFSTKAESLLYRSWGVDVIGMTNVTEAKLAREAGLCYATIALVTDYDCWHEEEEPVTVEMVLNYLKKNTENAKKIIKETIKSLPAKREKCDCSTAPKYAVITDKNLISEEMKDKLKYILE